MHDEALREFAEAGSNDLGPLLDTVGRVIRAEFLRRVADRGYGEVRSAYLPVFAGLDPQGTRITRLAERARLTRQAMTGLVHDVEALGYVSTRPDPGDARAVLVELTARGAAFCTAAAAVSSALSAELEQRLGGDDVTRVRDFLRSIAAEPDPFVPAPGSR